MGDISSDTSMEDILSSIKRIIAEEGEGAQKRSSRKAAPEPKENASGRDEQPEAARDPAEAVLELREAVADAIADPDRQAARKSMLDDAEPSDQGDAGEREAVSRDTLLSRQTAEASRGPLEALSRMIVKPDQPGSDTLEGLVREMLRPMLREWLDANLPGIVERMVAREISRITERDA
ncbi:DUF2497 domain-containing protein [Stakelama marina]|uniref:DUF2497 domain-containing protein n=1 Tax=Stakelama marina TaxID=2826939 RepID=A0A8T4IBA4_9SPHN|nr:DUF2497 domain-containing protein [Stakelama marina]MBR0551840.1 DUF2497 domain-containing protein [Stakelama marina]